MYAKGITNNNGTVALSFQHLGCVVEYKLKVPKSSQYTQVRFELKSNAEKTLLHDGVVNITDETPYISLVNETVSDSIMTVKLNAVSYTHMAFCETGYNGMEPGYGFPWGNEGTKRHGGPYPW